MMIVCELFIGDSKRIANIQHDVYYPSCRRILNLAISKHREAELVIGERSELSKHRDAIESYDHRTLQWLHDCIAGAFRMDYCLKGDLFSHSDLDVNDEAVIKNLWFDFLENELERIAQAYRCLPRLILKSVIFANPNPEGIKAENEIYEITRELYPDLHWFQER